MTSMHVPNYLEPKNMPMVTVCIVSLPPFPAHTMYAQKVCIGRETMTPVMMHSQIFSLQIKVDLNAVAHIP